MVKMNVTNNIFYDKQYKRIHYVSRNRIVVINKRISWSVNVKR